MIAHRAAAPGQEARAHAIGFLAEPQIEARGLELASRSSAFVGPDQFAPGHRVDLLPAEQAERRGEQGVGDATFGNVAEIREADGSGRRQRTSLEGRFASVAPCSLEAKT